jgi:hypothetical protein
MTIAPFGIATLIMPFLFAGGAWWTARRGSKWFWPLVILTVLAVGLAAVTIYSAVGGHVDSTSTFN